MELKVTRHVLLRHVGEVALSSHIDTSEIDSKILHEVVRISDFALQHKLTSDEQLRLIRLLGSFATRHELLMNMRRKPRHRA